MCDKYTIQIIYLAIISFKTNLFKKKKQKQIK